MFRILDLMSWVGIIIVTIYLVLLHFKVRTWGERFMVILGSVLFSVGQLLLLLRFKTVRGARFHYITLDDVHNLPYLYINYVRWVMMCAIAIFVVIKTHLRR